MRRRKWENHHLYRPSTLTLTYIKNSHITRKIQEMFRNRKKESWSEFKLTKIHLVNVHQRNSSSCCYQWSLLSARTQLLLHWHSTFSHARLRPENFRTHFFLLQKGKKVEAFLVVSAVKMNFFHWVRNFRWIWLKDRKKNANKNHFEYQLRFFNKKLKEIFLWEFSLFCKTLD